MTNKTENEIKSMATFAGGGFLSVAKSLRQLEDDYPEHFGVVAKFLGINRRDACSMARLDRMFQELDIDESYMTSLGWPKLLVLSDYITYPNRQDLLELAAKTPARDLAKMLLAQPPGTKPIVFYLRDEQYAVVEKAILAHGGTRQRRTRGGLAGKEEALVKALSPKDS